MDAFVNTKMSQLLKIENENRSLLVKQPHRTAVSPKYKSLKQKIDSRSKSIKLYKSKYKKTKISPHTCFKDFMLNMHKEKIFQLVEEKRKFLVQRIRTPYTDAARNRLRYHYVRYADDFIILGNFSIEFATKFKAELAQWLADHRKAKLSDQKTLTTNLLKSPAKFLGFELKARKTRKFTYIRINNKNQFRRTAGWKLTISPDRERMINRLYLKGFCDKKGFPKSMSWMVGYEPHIIISRFNAIMRGFGEYYVDYVTHPSSVNRWLYIIRWCCLKTLAQKYNTKIKKILKKFYDPQHPNTVTAKYIVVTKNREGQKALLQKSWTLLTQKQATWLSRKHANVEISQKLKKISRGGIYFNENYFIKRTPRVMDDNFLEKIHWVNVRTQASFDMPCLQCGSTTKVEMHHVASVKKAKISLIPRVDTIKKLMALRNRKQVPLCQKCHNKYHNDQLNIQHAKMSIPIIPTFDNRVVDIERFVHPGEVFQSLPYPDNFYEKGWKEVSAPPK
jgi:hypothetical protein